MKFQQNKIHLYLGIGYLVLGLISIFTLISSQILLGLCVAGLFFSLSLLAQALENTLMPKEKLTRFAMMQSKPSPKENLATIRSILDKKPKFSDAYRYIHYAGGICFLLGFVSLTALPGMPISDGTALKLRAFSYITSIGIVFISFYLEGRVFEKTQMDGEKEIVDMLFDQLEKDLDPDAVPAEKKTDETDSTAADNLTVQQADEDAQEEPEEMKEVQPEETVQEHESPLHEAHASWQREIAQAQEEEEAQTETDSPSHPDLFDVLAAKAKEAASKAKEAAGKAAAALEGYSEEKEEESQPASQPEPQPAPQPEPAPEPAMQPQAEKAQEAAEVEQRENQPAQEEVQPVYALPEKSQGQSLPAVQDKEEEKIKLKV